MLSWKRLLYVVLIVTVVSCVFMLYNMNEERARHVRIKNVPMEPGEYMGTKQLADGAGPQVWILGDDGEEIYEKIYRNSRQIFGDLHYAVREASWLDPEKLEQDALVVFCDESVGSYTDLGKLGDFIARGGKVILAAGLPEGNEDAYLWPLLGIREKSVRENYSRLCFEEALLPVQEEEMTYEGYTVSTWLAVEEDARVYIRDGDSGVPVLYTCEYGEGMICLINGTFLADIHCAGLLTGAAGAVQKDMLYPVLGTKTVFLDNFPMITYINDKLCMQMYGCSTESFVRDVVWPSLQGMSLRTDTPYTSSILAAASSDRSFPEINDSLFTTIGRSALQYNGELIYAANCREGEDVCFNQRFIEEFHDVFANYEMRGLAVQNGYFSERMLAIPGAGIKVVRTTPGAAGLGFSCDKEYLEFPAATVGNSMEEGNLFSISSILAAYGMVSHVFDINTLIAKDEDTASWDTDKQQIGLFEKAVLKKVPWLEGRVLSHTQDIVESYLQLQYAWKKEKDRVELDLSNAIRGQAFFFRTEGRIREAEGLSYEEAGNGYYILRVLQSHAVIIMEEE